MLFRTFKLPQHNEITTATFGQLSRLVNWITDVLVLECVILLILLYTWLCKITTAKSKSCKDVNSVKENTTRIKACELWPVRSKIVIGNMLLILYDDLHYVTERCSTLKIIYINLKYH